MKILFVLVSSFVLAGCYSAENAQIKKQLTEMEARQAIIHIEIQEAQIKMEYLRHHCAKYFPPPTTIADDEIK